MAPKCARNIERKKRLKDSQSSLYKIPPAYYYRPMVTFKDKDQIKRLAPSIFATQAHEHMSDRYSFIPSDQIIDQFHELGWQVTDAKQPKSYTRDPANKKHLVTFQPKDLNLTVSDPRAIDSQVLPQILMTNSSDGSSSLSFAAGLFALICENGLVIQTLDLGSFNQRHMNLGMETVGNAINHITAMVPNLANSIEGMSQKQLTHSEQLLLADQAKEARWGNESTVDSRMLLSPRRVEDTGGDLWTTFNVIQENTIQGGFKSETQKRVARKLTNMDALQRVNMALWSQAESLLQTA